MATTVIENSRYPSVEWIRSACPEKEISPLGARVATIIGQVVRGIYHVSAEVHRTDWSKKHCIEILTSSSWLANIATCDCNSLTELVLLCHDARIRLEICPGRVPTLPEDAEDEFELETIEKFRKLYANYGSADNFGTPALRLMFSDRDMRVGFITDRHPTIEDAVFNSRRLLAPVAEDVIPADELAAWENVKGTTYAARAAAIQGSRDPGNGVCTAKPCDTAAAVKPE